MPVEEPILDQVREYCASSEFQKNYSLFLRDKLDIFLDALDIDGSSSGYNHKLEYTEAYNDYVENFEDMITNFIENKGYSAEELQEECAICLESDKPQSLFVSTILALSNYEGFFELMMMEAREERRRQTRK